MFKRIIKKHQAVNPFLLIENLKELRNFYSFDKDFSITESDLDDIRFFEDLNGRRRLDAEVLSLISANAPIGNMLDIGTYLGHSAARMAINSPDSKIYTVNIHPDELNEGGTFVTGAPSVDQIGSFYRSKKINNINQIFANTKSWSMPGELDKFSLVYIDGSHDTEFVYNDTKMIINKIIKGGFILWHDCSPLYRANYNWIDAAMKGIEKSINEGLITPYILNVKHSWIGIWRKL